MSKIFKNSPIIVLVTFISPIIIGVLNFYVYRSQVSLVDKITGLVNSKDLSVVISAISEPLLILLIASLAQIFFNLLNNLFAIKLNMRATIHFQNEIIDVCEGLDYEYFSDNDFCNKLARAKNVVGNDLANITGWLVASVNVFSFLLSLIILSATSGYYLVTLIVSIMIIVNVSIKISTEIKVRKLGRELTFDGRVGDYLSNVLTDSKSIREMRVYGCKEFFIDLWGKSIRKQHRIRYNARRFEIKIGILVTVIQTTAILIVLLLMLNQIQHSSKITVGLMSILFLGLLQCNSKIFTLIWPISRLYVTSSKLVDLNDIIKMKKYITAKTYKTETKPTPIVMDHIHFSYKNNNKEILAGISLKINDKEKIAIVGENGVGKSTLIKLLLGLYKPVSGNIKWGNSSEVPENISIVYQDYIKYELTLRENVAFGNVTQINDNEEILKTLSICGLYELYEQLGSLDIPLGHLIDGGREISGGQWQRLAIARAIFRNSDLIIFDEPTAAIDPDTEVEIYKMLMDICKDKTAIFVSHRLGWAKNADRIIVLKNGCIVEEGTHSQLMGIKGLYHDMYELQSSWYTSTGRDNDDIKVAN